MGWEMAKDQRQERWSPPPFPKKGKPAIRFYRCFQSTPAQWRRVEGERRRAEDTLLRTFGLAVRCAAVVGWQRTQGGGDLLGNNSQSQPPVFGCCFVLVGFCRERKGKRDFFSQCSCMPTASLAAKSPPHRCASPMLGTVAQHRGLIEKNPDLPTLYGHSVAQPSHHWFTVLPAKLQKQSILNKSLGFLVPSPHTKHNYRFYYQV